MATLEGAGLLADRRVHRPTDAGKPLSRGERTVPTIWVVSVRASDLIAAAVALAGVGLAVVKSFVQAFGPYDGALLMLALAMLIIGSWWLGRQAAGTPFHEHALPVAVATVMPLLVGLPAPGFVLDSFAAMAPWLLTASAVATVGIKLADQAPEPYRTPVAIGAALLAVGAVAVAIFGPRVDFRSFEAFRIAAMLMLAAVTVVPGLVAAVLRHTRPGAAVRPDRNAAVDSLELAVLGLTPATAVVTFWGSDGSPGEAILLVAWIVAVLAVQFLAVRPLARRATEATIHRDAIVGAMEAERSRIAADIHDDALQDLTLLGWRLDSTGDREAAAAAREIAERLRAISGDLKLPILDDLGTGAALEWLVDRIRRLSQVDVRLERADPIRPPAQVELAVFRVAQEALSNAVRHGRPPVIVRYWTGPTGVTLTVDDAGDGFDPSVARGRDSARFGLANMSQRAEQIGAVFDVRRWPSGGTRVALEWRP